MIARSAAPLAIAAAGPLAERVFVPLLIPGGPLAASLGALTGVGAGRGIGLMFLCMGLLKAAAALCGALYRPLRAVEESLPTTPCRLGPGAPRVLVTGVLREKMFFRMTDN